MIKLRYGVMSDKSIEIEFKSDETAEKLLERSLKLHYGEKYTENLVEAYQIVINGNIIDRELLSFTKINKSDSVGIHPRLQGGDDFNSFLKVAIVITATVVAGPMAASIFGAGTVGAGLFVAGVSFAASMVANSLFPAPEIKDPGLGKGAERSQMYSISGQANQIKQFQIVPKVYGTHRIFPNVAATPYTMLEADGKGNMVQYYYAIYDFGLGPVVVNDIRIGDTSIDNYAGDDRVVSYRKVDLNRPLVDEGEWDEELYSSFTLYKGDVEAEQVNYTLDKNRLPGGSGISLADYQVVRNCSSSVDGSNQEIMMEFVFPNGLVAYDSKGNVTDRSVTLNIQFSKADENVWRSISDPNYVSEAPSIMGATQTSFARASRYDTNNLTQLSGFGYNFTSTSTTRTYGYKKGANVVAIQVSPIGSQFLPSPSVGDLVYNNVTNEYLGTITALSGVIVVPGPNGTGTSGGFINVRNATLSKPLSKNVVVTSITTSGSGTNKKTNRSDTTNVFRTVASSGSMFTATSRKTGQQFLTFSFKPKEIAAYKVRVIREQSFSSASHIVQDSLVFFKLTTRFDRQPIVTNKRHTFLEVKIKATNQLNGNIQNLSATCIGVVDVYDPNTQTWSKQETSNPAWVFADIITGEVNKKPLSKSRLDLDSLVEWAEFCDEIPSPAPANLPWGSEYADPRYTCNFVLDYDTTVQQLLTNICANAQASINIIDGKYGVLLDKNKTVPVQIFTNRNSWGFSSQRNYGFQPNRLLVKYVDPYSNWAVNEAVVYDTGFNASNWETEDEITAFACTSYEQAWRYGRYMMAQNKLRQENITINVDFEYLVCNRGDYVKYVQDVMKAGGTPARVKAVSGTQVIVDTPISTIVGENYGYIFRNVTLGVTDTAALTVINSTTFDLSGQIPSVGDLIVIGVIDSIAIDCIVKAIAPSDDLTASIMLVEKADAIYTVENTGTVSDYNPILSPEGNTAPGPVQNLIIEENTWRVVNNAYQYYIDVAWELPSTGAADVFEVYVDTGNDFRLITVTKDFNYEYIVDPNNLNIEHFFKVIAVSADGQKISLVDAPVVSAIPLPKTTPPSDVEGIFINITDEVLQLEWPVVRDPDIREYLVRYTPIKNGLWEISIPLVRTAGNTTSAAVQARTGTYLIKAIDLNGNQSVNAVQAYTSVPEIFNLNFIEETNDFPLLNGDRENVETSSGGLTLTQEVIGPPGVGTFYSEGFYYYDKLLDLGEIYTVRLQSQVLAEGFDPSDLMINWNPLADLLLLANSKFSDWDVEAQVRYTDQFNIIANWPSMDVIERMNEGLADIWSPWSKFVMGDFTGRIFQFRLRLLSFNSSVSPRVFDGKIKADMPDRIDSYNDIVSSNSSVTEVVFTPAFAGPDTGLAIQITQDNMQQGDYYVIVSKTLSKLEINFYDKDDNLVSRQFDVFVRGYGRKNNEVI